MEVIMIKCARCGQDYLTIYKSGDTECPMCNHVNKMLVGIDAEEQLKKESDN